MLARSTLASTIGVSVVMSNAKMGFVACQQPVENADVKPGQTADVVETVEIMLSETTTS